MSSTAAERRRAVMKLKGEMQAAVNAESDRRKRKNIQKDFEARIAAMTGTTEDTEAAEEEEKEDADAFPAFYAVKEKDASKAEKKREKRERDRKSRDQARLRDFCATDQSQQEKKRLELYTGPAGLQIHDIAADGNCLYRAIEHQLSLIPDATHLDYRSLRRACAKQILEHGDDYIFYLPSSAQEDLAAFCEQLAESDSYGGEIDLRVMSDMLGHPVAVYTQDGILRYNEDFEKPVLRVSFHRYLRASNHYNSLVQKTS